MKTISLFTTTGVMLLVVFRMNGILTDIPAIDAMVRLFMESIHLT